MTIRILLLSVLFTGMLALTGCQPQTAAQKADAEAKNTVAEKLIGKWKMVKCDRPLPASYVGTVEFMRGGTAAISTQIPADPRFAQAEMGNFTYRVEGNFLFIDMNDPKYGPWTIESISTNEFVASWWSGSEKQLYDFERMLSYN